MIDIGRPVKGNSLILKDASDLPRVKCKITKTKDAYYIAEMDISIICHDTLYPADDAATHNHHD